jgi:hypothetical protein
VIHLYALTGRDVSVAGVDGIDGAPLRCVPCGPLHAVVSDHPTAPSASRATALTHADVVATVAASAPTLPVRFGTDHADRDALCRSLEETADRLVTELERIGGCVEFVVRGAGPPPVPTPPATPATVPSGGGPGRAYLERRLAEEQATRSAEDLVAEQLRTSTEPLDRLAVDVQGRRGPAGVERCYLVPGRDADRFAAAADRIADRDALVVGGPWPPYTFAEAGP